MVETKIHGIIFQNYGWFILPPLRMLPCFVVLSGCAKSALQNFIDAFK